MSRASKRVRIEGGATALLNVCNHPDGNGVELYWDRPREEWPRDSSGGLAMFTRRLDLEDLLRAAPEERR